MTGAEKKQSIDAVALLKTALLNADHRNVDTLFEDLELASKSELKVRIVQQICSTLTSHALAEEKTFYPALYETLKKKKRHTTATESSTPRSGRSWPRSTNVRPRTNWLTPT